MSFEVRPILLENIEEACWVIQKSYAAKGEGATLWPNSTAEGQHAWFAENFRYALRTDPACRFSMVVETSSGKIVGMCKWAVPYTKSPGEKEHPKAQDVVPYPEGSDPEAFAGFYRAGAEKFGKYVDPETTYTIRSLATLPEYERRGVASMLVKNVTDQADAHGAKAFLMASRFGVPMYKRLGFVDQGEPGFATCMLREPLTKN